MAYLYTIKSTQRKLIRKIIKEAKAIHLSSCYLFAENYYFLMRTAERLPVLAVGVNDYIASPLLATNYLFASKSPLRDPRNTLLKLDLNELNADEFIFAWANSELLQTSCFVEFEDNAEIEIEGCSHQFNRKKITRLYSGLSELMLIINITPDSFSELGTFYQQPKLAIQRIKQAIAAGVALIDIGAESTRPNALLVDSRREIERLAPLILELKQLRANYDFKLSLDSYRSETINHFFADLDIINDVTANLPDWLLSKIAAAGKSYVFMHSLTIPANPAITLVAASDLISELLNWGSAKINRLLELGFQREQLIFDVGIGFNKTMAQSWYLLRNIAVFHSLGVELLVGHSRKRFLAKVTNHEFGKRDFESAVLSAFLQQQRVDYLRVHDYEEFQLLEKLNNQLTNSWAQSFAK